VGKLDGVEPDCEETSVNPTRREALATALALTGNLRPAIADEPKLRLSTFIVEITPPLGHPCMGGGIAPAKEIVDPLFAHGFILQGVGKPIAMVALDWCEVRNGAYELFRDNIAKYIDTDPVRVMVSSLHQHDAPIADLEAQQLLEKHKAKEAICDIRFLHLTVLRIAGKARDSLRVTQPITHIGTGEAKVEKVASNRRYVDGNGKVQYNRMSATRDPKIREGEEGTIDPMLKTLSFWDGDTPILGLSAYATHPMSYYGKGEVSADFIGMARRVRQAELPNAFQTYVSGCSGNVTAGKYNEGDRGNRPILAERLRYSMVAAWKGTKKTPVKEVAFRSVPLVLKPRSSKGFSEEELTKRLTMDAKPFGQCLAALGLSWKKRCESGRPIDVPVLDFGNAVVTLLPAESYVEYQLMAQQARPEAFVLVAGYGECGPGYIPIERAWTENDSNLSDWCWVNPGSEKLMSEAIKAALKR
jgi:hypothetical protein